MSKFLGEFINSELNKRGWSESDLSKRSGLSKSYVRNLIKNKGNTGQSIYPSIDTIEKIASAFNFPPYFVFNIALGNGGESAHMLEYESARNLIRDLNMYCKETKFINDIDLENLSETEVLDLAQEILLALPSLFSKFSK